MAYVNEGFKWILISFLVVVWSVNILAPIFVHSYKPPPEVHVAFMSVIGIIAAQKTGNGGDPP